MYQYEYEDDVLSLLRLLKYLKETVPAGFRDVCETFKELDTDSLYDAVDYIVWEVFNNEYMETDDDDEEFPVICFSDPIMDRYLELNERWHLANGGLVLDACRRKLQDAVEYYAVGESYSLCGCEVNFCGNSPVLRLALSPDCYEAVAFCNSILDLLMYFQKENERLAKILEQRPEAKVVSMNEFREEAA